MLGIKLVIVGGGTEGDEFRPTLPAILGRSREATLPLPHPLVSRQHCELVERDEQLYVRDLGSTNGTFVGSERVEAETLIEHGSLLTIGTVTLRAFYDGVPLQDSPSHYGRPDEPVYETEQASTGDTSTITRIDTGRVNVPRRKSRTEQTGAT